MDDSGQNPSVNSQLNQNNLEPDYSLLSGANATFIAEMNAAWLNDPTSVDQSWATYFKHLSAIGADGDQQQDGPSWGPPVSRVGGAIDPEE